MDLRLLVGLKTKKEEGVGRRERIRVGWMRSTFTSYGWKLYWAVEIKCI